MQSTALNVINNPALQFTLSNGEYLSYAKYASYIPGAPSLLKNPVTGWLGDTCRVANATIGIGSKVVTLANPVETMDKKAMALIGIAQHILSISNTNYGEYIPQILPKSVCNKLNKTYETAKMGVESKNKLTGLSINDKIEGLQLGTLGANQALSLAGYGFLSPARLTLGAGYYAFSAAKMVTSTAKFFGSLI